MSAYLSQVRQALIKDFVSSNLGAASASRSEFLSKNSFIAEKLFSANNGQLIRVADGTYCYIQKSRHSFSDVHGSVKRNEALLNLS